MKNLRSLQDPLIPRSPKSPSTHQPNHSFKPRKLKRSRSAPVIVCIPVDPNTTDRNLSPEPRTQRIHQNGETVAIFLCFYLGVGTVCFYLLSDHLTGRKTYAILDALYFSVVTMTTVGYGDLVPNSDLSKLLACAFVFAGMAFIVLVLSKAADYLVEKQEVLMSEAMELSKKLRPDTIMSEIETKKVKYKCVMTGIVLVVLLVAGILVLMGVEKLNFIDAFYTVCVTVTSLGYGDHSFKKKRGRAFAVLWILASTVCLAQFFFYLAELNTERRQNALVKWVLTRRMTIYDLEGADIDNDGEVNAAEFVLYKLKEMRKIKQEDVSMLIKEFEELDVNQAGTLSIFDLTNNT